MKQINVGMIVNLDGNRTTRNEKKKREQ
jgi:hypothetical protein